jgi:glycosyltransferase involved in cell wall biosynthesis
LRQLYNGAKAFIMANEEDFGLVMAEAMACGTPVIAYSEGGAMEIVEPHATGMLFHSQTVDALAEVLQDFERVRFDRKLIAEKAKKFDTAQFVQGITKAVTKIAGLPQ